MRITTVFRRLIGVTRMYVEDVAIGERELVVAVRPSARVSRCGDCGRRCPRYDRRPERRWRHLPYGALRIVLRYAPWRVSCPACGVRIEQVSWAGAGSRFTEVFEEMAAYLAQGTDRTQVSRLLGISWRSVGSIVQRVVERSLDEGRLEDLRRIGVDEFGYRKRHRYVTIVVDHDRRRVIWAGTGRSAETLSQFFEQVGEARSKIETVTIDMAGGYLKAIREWIPEAEIVFDRFHVERLAQDAVDEVRREMVREQRRQSPEKARALKGTRYLLLKHPDRLSAAQHGRLSDLQRTHHKLYRAYLLKETLADALEQPDLETGTRRLEEWLVWAQRCRIPAFVRIARTVRRYFDGILAYVETGLTNGLTEGLNAKLRVVARRAYGFHSASALIGMLFLCCGGITLQPPLPAPT